MVSAAEGLRRAAWGLLLVLTAFYLSWRVLAAVDFAYPLFYEPLGLERNIETFGPQNAVRPGFHRSTREERFALFAAIGRAIRDDGRGLEDLRYHDAGGRELGRLLTAAEIVHLRDVAHLVRRFERVGLIATLGFAGVLAWSRYRRRPPLSTRALLGGGCAALAGLAAVLMIVGPRRTFYWLHVQVFPPDHPWFFYYQDSLMSMMMRAPVLFAGIGALWLALALIVAALLQVLAHRLVVAGTPAGGVSESRANSRSGRRSRR